METAARQKIVNRAATAQPAAAPLVVRQVRPAPAGQAVTLQAALKVSSPRDPAEREAEASARQILRMPQPEAAPAPKTGWWQGLFRKSRAAEEEKEPAEEKKTRQDKDQRVQRRFLPAILSRLPFAGLISRWRRPTGEVQRQGDGQPRVTPETAAELQSGMTGGEPLPTGVRRFMEPRFRADFSPVRIHQDDRAARLNRRLQAQAFTIGRHVFFGRDQFRPQTSEGKELIAHELTHTIQQGEVIQRRADVTVTQAAPVMVQRLGLSDALDYFADKANIIPGFRMFTIILGINPINMSRVDRSAANILRALIEFIPGGGLITQALDNYGIFDRVGTWVEQQIRTLAMTGAAIRQAVNDFLDSLSWSDIFDLGDVWRRAKRIFTEPIDRIINFAKGLVNGIITFIKEAILRPLAKLAEGTRGYDLLKAVLGEDPVTGDPVPRNADTLIGGFMKLIGQEEIWNNLKKANAVARAWAWFQGALASLLGFVRQIPGLFVKAFKSLELTDIVLLPRAFAKVAAVFGSFLGSFLNWGLNAVWNLLEIIFAVVAPGAIPYVKRAGAAFRSILQNPIGFLGNLIRAAKQGFLQFAARIGHHLKTSLIQWLTGTLAGAGVYIPQALEIREIIKFVLSVLGLTWQNIRAKLVRAIGETAAKTLETGFDIVVTLVKEGPAAAWEKIKEQLTNLKDIVIEEIKSWVITKVVQEAVRKLISFLSPVGAFIQAIIAIYNTIMFFVERLKQIMRVAMSFIDSMAAIAAGAIAAAANRVESTMAGLLTLVISFLARFAGLGRVSDAVKRIIDRIRAPIDKALDRVVDWIVTMAKKLGKLIAATAAKVFSWAFAKSSFSDEEGKSHSISVSTAARPAKLMIASTPVAAGEFLEFYVAKQGADFQKDNSALIAKARTAVTQAQQLVNQIDTLQQANPQDPKLEGLQRSLLNKNVELSGLLSQLVGSDASIGKAREKYLLEGLTGTYGSIPKPRGDDFTADHQPQAAILQAAAAFDYFSDTGEMAKRAAGRAKAGFAINLHKIRHEAGRTYGAKGKKTKEAFLVEIAKLTQGKKTTAAKRQAVVTQIKADMAEDVKAMTAAAQAKAESPNWADIMSTKLHGKKADKEKLVGEIRGRIVAGEAQIAAQDIDSLIT